MPEGDTIHHAARRIREALVGQEIATPHPRHGRDRWPERLSGHGVRALDAKGKHLNPWRPAGEVPDEEALRIVREARPLMRLSAEREGRIVTNPGTDWETWVYAHAGEPCRRCGIRLRSRGQGDDRRTTYWCPGCQA